MFRLNVHRPINLKKFDIHTQDEDDIKYKQNSSNGYSESEIQKEESCENLGQQYSAFNDSGDLYYYYATRSKSSTCPSVGIYTRGDNCKWAYHRPYRTASEPVGKQWTVCKEALKFGRLNKTQSQDTDSPGLDRRRRFLHSAQSKPCKHKYLVCDNSQQDDGEADDDVFVEVDCNQRVNTCQCCRKYYQKYPHLPCHVSSMCFIVL